MNGFQRSGFQHPGFQGGEVVGPTYGGVWRYGLAHWKRLRGEEEEEPEPEVVAAVASVASRTPYPEQDAAGRLLLRLETERRGRAWQQIYLDTLEAWRAGFGEYLDELRAADRTRRVEMARIEAERAGEAASRALLRRRRLAALLLLDS